MMLRRLFFFPPRKAFGFFLKKNSLELVSLITYATYCFGAGPEEASRQAWVLAESSRTRHSYESTGTDYSLRRPHRLTPTRPGPTILEYFPAQHGLHHIQNRRLHRTNEKRHNLVFDDMTWQDGTPGFDLCRDVQFWPSEQIRYPLSPGTRAFFEPLMLFFPPPPFSLPPRRPSPRRTITYEKPDLCVAWLNHYPIDVISQQPEKFPHFHSFNSLLLQAFDLFSTTSDSGVPRLVTLMALTERGKMDENI